MSGISALRAPALTDPRTAWSALPPAPTLAVVLAGIAIVLQLTISSNILLMFHIPYNTDGGNPIVKFHPGTYFTFAALAVRLFSSDRPGRIFEQLALRHPKVILFQLMIVLCITWMVLNVGVSGVAVYVESYLSASVLFLVLSDSSLEVRRRLGVIMLGLFVMNAIIASAETAMHHTLFPFYLGADVYSMLDSEFRGVALYNHPLTGSMMTQMGILLLAQMRLSPRVTAACGVPLMVGLISFGGRTALLATMVTIILVGGYFMVRGLLDRTLRPVVILGAIAGVLLVAAMLYFLITETSIGIRLAGKLTLDDNSSKTRNFQWLMVGLMSTNELLFGITQDRMVQYIYQLGLTYDFHIVENFWLLGFIYLGAVGFIFYLLGFFSYLFELWKYAPLFGRAIVLTIILVASTSNSLGQKSNVLFMMTATVIATSGYARRREVPGAASASFGVPGLGVPSIGAPNIGVPGLGVAGRGISVMTAPARRGGGPLGVWGHHAGSAGDGVGAGRGAASVFRASFEDDVPPSTQGGVVRDEASADRALRPLRLPSTRTSPG